MMVAERGVVFPAEEGSARMRVYDKLRCLYNFVCSIVIIKLFLFEKCFLDYFVMYSL